MNDINEVVWEETAKHSGRMGGHWQVENARNIKFLSGEKQLWQPLMYENDRYHCGPRERCIPSPVEQKLSIAEAYVGAATSRNIEGRPLRVDQRRAGGPEGLIAIAQYNHFSSSTRISTRQRRRRGLLDFRRAAESTGRRIPQAERLRDQAGAPRQGSPLTGSRSWDTGRHAKVQPRAKRPVGYVYCLRGASSGPGGLSRESWYAPKPLPKGPASVWSRAVTCWAS